MRIGLVTYAYPPRHGAGGVSMYMFRLASALGQAGHEVHVIAGPSDQSPLPQPNVTVHNIEPDFQLKTRSRAMRWLYWNVAAKAINWCSPSNWHLLRWDLATEAKLIEIGGQKPFNAIEAPEFAGNGWMAGRLRRWPLVVRVHCPTGLFSRINRFPFNPMTAFMDRLEQTVAGRYAARVTAPSQAMARYVREVWQLRRPVRIIPNFADVPAEPYAPPDPTGPQRVICVGRIEPLKGQDTLAQAFAMVAPRHPQAELWLIGPDRWGRRPFAQLLPSLVPDPTIRARIYMPGTLPFEQVETALKSAAAAVVASTGFESFSLSALEAMCIARPVVACATGALPELIEDGKSGRVVPAGRPYEMALALDQILGDPAIARQLGLAAHARARDLYDRPKVLPVFEELYRGAGEEECWSNGMTEYL